MYLFPKFFLSNVCQRSIPTVQTFNACTSRPIVSQCLVVQPPMDNLSKGETSTTMTHVACESKLRSVVRSSMHPRPGKWVAVGLAVAYHARAARSFSDGIKCRHCILLHIIQGVYVCDFFTTLHIIHFYQNMKTIINETGD